jgi:hypothetical protein
MSVIGASQPYFRTSVLHLGIGLRDLSIVEGDLRVLVRPLGRALAFPADHKKRNAGIDFMTNTNERATAQVLGTSDYRTAQVFGLSLTAVFVGLLILNGISF